MDIQHEEVMSYIFYNFWILERPRIGMSNIRGHIGIHHKEIAPWAHSPTFGDTFSSIFIILRALGERPTLDTRSGCIYSFHIDHDTIKWKGVDWEAYESKKKTWTLISAQRWDRLHLVRNRKLLAHDGVVHTQHPPNIWVLRTHLWTKNHCIKFSHQTDALRLDWRYKWLN